LVVNPQFSTTVVREVLTAGVGFHHFVEIATMFQGCDREL